MSQPTKLPDDMFPDPEWVAADYHQRVLMLAWRFAQVTGQARVYLEELRDLRERNAALVSEIERMYRDGPHAGRRLAWLLDNACFGYPSAEGGRCRDVYLVATGIKNGDLADVLAFIDEKQKETTHPTEGAGK